MPGDSDFEEPSATKAGKRSATNKKPPKSAKKSKKSNKDGKKAAKLSTAKPKKVSAAVSGTLDFKTTGDPSALGEFLGQSRLQRGNSETAIKETTQCVIENGFMDPGSGGGSGRASSYGEQGGHPTQSSLDDIAREVGEEDTIASRTKRDRRCKTNMKFMAKTAVAQNVHLAKLVQSNDFDSALDEGTAFKKDNVRLVN